MDLGKMRAWLEHMEEDENAGVDGTAQAIEEELHEQGQQLFYDNENGYWYIGKRREDDEE